MSEEATIAAAPRDESQLVTFYLGEEEFGFDIMSVQEIIRQPKLARIPMAPSYVEGIANLRGMVLPIIDTRTRFGMERAENTDRTRVLVVDVDGNKTGLRVDRVRQVTRIQQNEMELPPAVIREGASSGYLKSVVKLDEGKRIIMALNPKAICKITQAELGQTETASQAAATATGGPTGGAAEDQSITQLVTFKLGLEEFAFHMERVREILRVERPSEVPNTPKHVLGVLTVRGNILPVIDLRVMLGLNNLESEVVAEAAEIATQFKAWLASAGQAAAGKTKLDVTGPEAVRKWTAGFNTSSQVLMEVLSQMRVANDKLLRGVLQTQAQPADESGAAERSFKAEVANPAQEVARLLESFQGSVRENIREDQRLIVVQAHGSLLALLVDKVREVLNMPKNQIDPPPQHLSESRNVELSGIAKLDQGKRLIMLLESNNLIKEQELQKLGSTVGQSEGALMQKHEVKNEGNALGEQQFVTFRLGEGEYGIPISRIQEIDRSSKMTRVPRTADYMDGITNLRGEVVPVINARKRFHLEHKDADERTRVIIIDMGGVKTGLLVDSVREVLNLPAKDIAPPPSSLSTTIDRQYIFGIGKADGDKRMIILLDVEKILQK